MKKRILSILLLCCMMLTLLPTTAFAAGGAVRPAATQYTYTLHYDANGGSGAPPSQSMTSSELSVWIPISDKIPTRDGYTFKGWADSPNGEPKYLCEAGYYWNCLMVHPSLSETIYAIWEVHNHSWGEWTSNGNGTHKRTCSLDSSHTETGSCSGGKATSTEKAVCETCHTPYGELLPPAQALASVNITFPAPKAGENISKAMKAASGNADSGLTLYLTGPALWKQGEEPDKLDENAAYVEGNIYLLNFTFYTQKPITAETVVTFNGQPVTRYTDYAAFETAANAYDGKQDTCLGFVMFSEDGLGDPSMAEVKNIYIVGLYAFVRVPEYTVREQFTLTPGGRYYFDLSAMNIPGTVNSELPDSTLHYVPFTYAGTVDAYKLASETTTTEEYAQQNKYLHSLFIADYAVTHKVSWDDLNTADLIFGKDYAAGGVGYTLRAPSVGSDHIGSGDIERGTPQSNEWDAVLDKNSGYIKNWNGIYSWGQDTTRKNSSNRAVRGYTSARFWLYITATSSYPSVCFRPVLEILNPNTLSSDGLKVVTLDLGGGTLGGSSDAIQIIVKNGSDFTAPASDGMTRPNGDTGSYFMWLGSDGKLYAPGASVPAEVTKLTAQFALSEQFSLTPGGRYYFDLSAMNIPGTVNSNLSDSTLHYVPFTYTGTVYAYSLSSNSSGVARSSQAASTAASSSAQYGYARDHSLFIADYAVTHSVSWLDLNAASLIFGKDYASGNISYALRAPSVGSKHKPGSDADEHGNPENNEWDAILNKARQDWQDNTTGYIKNWKDMYSTGQDTAESPSTGTSQRMKRGYTSVRCLNHSNAGTPFPYDGFRPVLEVLHADTLGSDALKTVVLDLNGGSIGDATGTVNIVVKNGESFTAPSGEGLTRPNGNTDSYFWWLGSDGESYVPGAMIPAGVTSLTAQWTALTYSVTLHENGGTISSGNVTSYNYGEGATLPTAGDMTREGYTFAGWYDNEVLTGNPITEISTDETGNRTYWAKWTVNQYTITYDLAGGTAEGNLDTYTIETGAFTLKNPTRPGYTFTGWSGTGLTGEDNLTVTIPKGSTGNRSYTAHWRYNGGGGGSSYSYYTIKATAGTGGSISPSGNVSVRGGRDQTLTITPDKGYTVSNVKIDGKSIGAVKSYTFENVRRTHTIEVSFMKANGNPQTDEFVDVATGSYYENAVDWAVKNGITKGTDDIHFSPGGICTRAQAVTFLWRAAGSPAPETSTMPFTDVPAGSYYYDAVLWAVENGITKGTGDTTFSPNMTCSRAQIVTFLWRSEKSPASGTVNPFADVKPTAYYADAVLWAVKKDITKGTANTTFSPDADCTRAQIVTFLWRCKK